MLVLLVCSSSMITTKFVPSLWASAILSNRFCLSPSFSALFPRLVTSSQFTKVMLPGVKPVSKEYNKFLVSLCGVMRSICSLLCSSKSPLPGHSQTNAVLLSVLFKYSSIYLIRIIVFPAPVGALTVITFLLSRSTVF